jgi:hypothetical protein
MPDCYSITSSARSKMATAAIQAEAEALEKRSQAENDRWEKIRGRLQPAQRCARDSVGGSEARAAASFTFARSRRSSGASSFVARWSSAGMASGL